MAEITKEIFRAFGMKGEVNELWQLMVRIEAKHADHNTPWRDAEIEHVCKESRKILDKLPETKYNKMRRTKALALLKRMEEGETDYFILNNFRDTIHNIWKLDLVNASGVEIHEEVEKEYPDSAWDADKYAEMTDKNYFISENFPWDKDHTKKKYDIIERKREYFLAKFLEIHGGQKMRDRFWTFLHDIDEADRHATLSLDNVIWAQEAFALGKIPAAQLSSFVKRSVEEAIRWLRMGPDTWKEKDDTWQPLWAEAFYFKDLIKGRKSEQDCNTRNCNEDRDFPQDVLDKMAKGEGIENWYCPKHAKKKPESTADEDDD